ncbi:enoyl-CoA hydratase/isomerase family protein [Rhodovibrio salinarum]|uniref:enoyl-CoA hydratase/isomerase family protein n=1 Tax=Rhodovibrio salinarum TaxID=1087 RepID=UPI0004B696A5|nr:enoyl-CoA hydratase/isomerase family protein [Rhodovibrio salinarum]
MSEQTTGVQPEPIGGTEEIAFARRGALGEVKLARPKALNALTLGMVETFDPQLRAWGTDTGVQAVLIRGQGEKAFCAGGDVRAVWEDGKALQRGEGDGALTRRFFWAEYSLNRLIHQFSKPYVAWIDGITMGGGLGLSMHGSHRVAGDRTLAAMPETGIGFFPDVGATWVLPRLPGAVGMYLALTGARLKAADAVYAGLATHYVPSEAEVDLAQALAEADLSGDAHAAVDRVLGAFTQDPGPAPLQDHRAAIDRCFGQPSLELVLRALEAEGSAWANDTLETLSKRSPTSVKLTFAALQRGRHLDFDSCMTMEYRLSQACMGGHDYYEGIRAVLVDKDHAPQWQPATIEQVDDEVIERAFHSLSEHDLVFEP